MTERRRRQAMISVRLTPDEEAQIRAAAARQGHSVSDYVRRAALRASGRASVPSSWSGHTAAPTGTASSGVDVQPVLLRD